MENLDSILEMSVPDWRIWIRFWKRQFLIGEFGFGSGKVSSRMKNLNSALEVFSSRMKLVEPSPEN